jgi:hypothetical protein
MRQQTRKNVPWRGWKNERPNYHQRTVMRKKCGSKCFLGPKSKKSFPICKKNTCQVSRKGVYAAYVRARQTKRNKVSQKAKRMLFIV